MPYITRILPPKEYQRLPGITADQLPDASRSLVVVVENERGEIVGRWMALDVVALEGLQIEEGHRGNPVVAKLLLGRMLQILTERRVASVLTIVQSAEVERLAGHAGFDPVPGTLFQKDLR